jgi:glycosyltransferase involved in cell wall biosynthesis
MKILQIHNEYIIKGGEDIVVDDEKKLLQKNGHKVDQLIRKNKNEIKSILDWFSVLNNLTNSKKSTKILEDYLKKNKTPDIVHIHNLFPLWSFSVIKFFIIKKIPIVITLHNYRFLWSKIKLFDKNSFKYGFFKDSKILTLIIGLLFNKNHYFLKYVSFFICLTKFQKKLFKNFGFNEKQLMIKQHSLKLTNKYIKWKNRNEKIIYLGRLSPEKGIHTLLKAWKIWGKNAPILEIIGTGKEEEKLKKYKEEHALSNVFFTGKLTYKKVQKKIEKSKLLIIPSEWYEPFGLVILEAFSKGTPVAASNIGSLPNLITNNHNGFTFKNKNEYSLFRKVKKAWTKENYLEKLSKKIKNTSAKFHIRNNNYQILISIYNKAIENNKIISNKKIILK